MTLLIKCDIDDEFYTFIFNIYNVNINWYNI